ncbi:winged helix-turn-helix transcriptional regulator [Telmatocola sphagniphila]|uniref:Winged helix-turn-helix transcriptional regulator n=1 Tax=Telmatocola sphagniphila TaxID=1123043 RepID=A0A8E6B993_9BACT|nr:metalloregulator ArsR/SmtB family transcription factor [Telmatocola sphagniphila]QVL34213.1 winged helix-turn-helix transcriptional regulator [Telmatocola sphagniphila]
MVNTDSMPEILREFKASLFRALANPTRIAIVELLRDEGEIPVTRIYEKLEIEQANASQHLAVLRGKNIVLARKEGNQVFYRLRDKLLGKLLDLMKTYFHSHLSESLALMHKMEKSTLASTPS